MPVSSFQSYIDKIKLQTGKDIDEFSKYAKDKNFFKPDVKPGLIVDSLKKDFQLKHGDAVAMYGLFKHMGLIVKQPKTKVNIDKL